jgi:hypothetical protein
LRVSHFALRFAHLSNFFSAMRNPIPHAPTRFQVGALLLSAGLFLTACNDDPQPRRYREIAARGEGSNLQRGTLSNISWKLPAGWTVQPEGDPLRLTGFWAPDPELLAAGQTDPDPVDVSIVQLGGMAGGLEANVTRWLGQIGVPASQASAAIAAATPVKTASGQTGVVVDFTGFMSGDLTQSKSIVGAILEVDGGTMFVKAMGQKPKVARLRPVLVEFVKNLSIGGKP